MSYQEEERKADQAAERKQARLNRRLITNYRQALKMLQMELNDVLNDGRWSNAYRLLLLETQLIRELNLLGVENVRAMRETFVEMYMESFGRSWYGIEQELKVQLDFFLMDREAVARAVDMPIRGVRLDGRMRQNHSYVRQTIRDEIARGLALGKDYGYMAKKMAERISVGMNRALLIAQTQGHQATQRGRLDAFNRATEAGVEMWNVWDATLDKRTRASHRALDGQRVRPGENFRSPLGATGPGPGQMGSARENIRCRCSVRGELEGFSPTERRDNITKELVPYQTYEQWAQARIQT
jgi:uncharacterized protein with gpF-like domain